MAGGWYLLVAGSLVLVLILIAFARAALLIVSVQGLSMSPTLRPGDRVLVARRWPRRWLRRGQIAIVTPPSAPPAGFEEDFYIKRIVGLPGDTLVTALDELDASLRPALQALHDADGRRAWLIPPGHCFVRGDHPLSSADSRTWGPLPYAALRGVVIKRLPRPAPPERDPGLPQTYPLVVGLAVGRPSPPFTAATLLGQEVSSARYAGRSLALIMIAPCHPVREMVPGIEAIAPAARRAGVEVVLISLASRAQTQAFVDELGIRLPVLVAPEDSNSFMHDYQIGGWPCYCLVDEQGIVRSTGIPIADWGDWKLLVEAWQAGIAGSQWSVVSGQ